MADKKREELTIAITVDVDEAVAGLKRLQREFRKTTQEMREYEEALKGVPLAIDGEGNINFIGEFMLGKGVDLVDGD